ncbi:hypothetical protein PIB30_099072 [Stylosanthes scabra]|uniref:Uncharacterized protein n=1 Tax=Stylosanthes scabra TaxID=79078 RepID=A0ABU6SX03_9FABA|nr:hypothetical protein [Stylosanthes scabra]
MRGGRSSTVGGGSSSSATSSRPLPQPPSLLLPAEDDGIRQKDNVYFRSLRIENSIGNAKENIRRNGFMKMSQKEEIRAPQAPLCVCTVPWEHLERVSAQLVR